jgi:DNA-binding transcriptional ArsR family regulator
LGHVRIADSPDFGAELTAAGRHHVSRRAKPAGLLGQLYSRSTSPDLEDGGTVTAEYLSCLFAFRSPTPFTRALAEGDEPAHAALSDAVGRLRDAVVDPRRPQIHAAVSAQAALWTRTVATRGVAPMLEGLGRGIVFRNGRLDLPTTYEADLDLDDRSLVVQPVALNDRVTLAEPAADHIAVRIPTAGLPRLRESRSEALAALMGSKKAEVLLAIIETGGMSGRRLAATLGVSDGSASRHAAILRSAGLVETRRVGKSVHHVATAVGYLLAGGEQHDSVR